MGIKLANGDGPTVYPGGVASHSPGSRSAPWVQNRPGMPTLKGLQPGATAWAVGCNPFGVAGGSALVSPGCAARPWAVGYNPFGVENGRAPLLPTAFT